MTGPGEADTTFTSTPNSASLRSIISEVNSSASGLAVSTASSAGSSRCSGGSGESGRSENSGACFSVTARSDCGTSFTTGSMRIGGASTRYFFSTETFASRFCCAATRVRQRHRPVPGAQPFDAGTTQQQQTEPAQPEPALTPACQRGFIEMPKGMNDIGCRQHHPPPGRQSKQHQQQIRQPRADTPAQIAQRTAVARGAEARVGRVVGKQDGRQQQRSKAHQQGTGFAQQSLHTGRQGSRRTGRGRAMGTLGLKVALIIPG